MREIHFGLGGTTGRGEGNKREECPFYAFFLNRPHFVGESGEFISKHVPYVTMTYERTYNVVAYC